MSLRAHEAECEIGLKAFTGGKALIPNFTSEGFLPPFLQNDPQKIANMSPYQTDMDEVVSMFAQTPERAVILKGLLAYREALRNLGFVGGFQWLDGSFSEHIELTERRPPQDIDVVSFVYRPAGHTADGDWQVLLTSNQNVFDPKQAKINFKCDAYPVDLTLPQDEIVNLTRYWFGLFSHKRFSKMWKGLLRIELTANDTSAHADLYNRYP